MSSLSGLRGRLLLQAGLTALFAVAGSSAAGGWTVPTLVVAAATVFVSLAMRPEPTWRWPVTGYVGFTVAYGAFALVAGHYVPGTIVGAYTLFALSQHGAAAFAGAPAWQAPDGFAPAPLGAPAVPAQPVGYGAPVAYAPPPPPPSAPPVVDAPVAYAPPVPAAVAAPAVHDVQPASPAYQPPVEAAPLTRPIALTILPGR